MMIEPRVFINHGLTCMSAGGITLEEGVMIGPDVSLLTVNHDKEDLQIIICKSIVIKKGAWIGATASNVLVFIVKNLAMLFFFGKTTLMLLKISSKRKNKII